MPVERRHPVRELRSAVRRATDRVAARADRLWRPPLVLASALFALSGPAQALGKTDTVFYAALAGLTLGGIAVPLGLLALRTPSTIARTASTAAGAASTAASKERP